MKGSQRIPGPSSGNHFPLFSAVAWEVKMTRSVSCSQGILRIHTGPREITVQTTTRKNLKVRRVQRVPVHRRIIRTLAKVRVLKGEVDRRDRGGLPTGSIRTDLTRYINTNLLYTVYSPVDGTQRYLLVGLC